jgi:hypothetical protein
MAYQIDRFDNSLLTTVEDGTIDQTTNIKFIGKNYAGYGEIQNENLLFLLENFAGGNAPTRAIRGQLWYDSTNSKLKYFVATPGALPGIGYWKSTGGSEISSSAPNTLVKGDFWWDEVNNQLYVHNGTAGDNQYTLVGPQSAGSGITNMVSEQVIDTLGASKTIIKAVINDQTSYIISNEEFDLGSLNPIEGFDRIRKGLTLKHTRIADNGVTNSTNVVGNDFVYHGTASNAAMLGGVAASAYALSAAADFSATLTAPSATIDGIFGLSTQSGAGVLSNNNGSNSEIIFKTTNASGTLTDVAKITHPALVPVLDNVTDLGSPALQWAEVHAVNFRGEADKATNLKVNDPAAGASGYQPASIAAGGNTIAARDASGDLTANVFHGTATKAQFADLAEKYTTAEELPAGTAVAVCGHPDHEVEPASASSFCIGVVSTDPAYMMNSEAEGQYIGLKGRLPVRVKGPVSKGMAVYAWAEGVCTTIASTALVGIALETNNDEGEKLVECVLKV